MVAMKNRHILSQLKRNEDGIAAVEFGLIGTIFITLLLAGFDLGHSVYVKTVVEGVLQDAARNSSLQTGSVATQQAALDAVVTQQVLQLNKSATVSFSRRFYKTLTAANNRRHEQDINAAVPAKANDGTCEVGTETYLDVNNNNTYDADGGDQGQGGAQDTVIYTATISYPRVFPVAGLLGASPNVTIRAATVMQNQPYSAQSQYGPATTRNC
jgi:Flp pilus assembly protein TadG